MDATEQRLARVGLLLDAIEHCLRDEHRVLVEQKIEDLPEIAVRKETLLRQLDASRRESHALASAEKLPGMGEIQDALRRCQVLSRDNARLIDRGVARVEIALKLLRVVDDERYYGPQPGLRKPVERLGRTLGIA